MSVGHKSTKEKFMKKTILIMLIVLLTFSLTFIGCSDNKGANDPDLYGTWVGDDRKIKFDDDDFSLYNGDDEVATGTYDADAGKITMTIEKIKYGTRWITKDQLATLIEILGEEWGEIGEIEEIFEPTTLTYSISGGKLTLRGKIFGEDINETFTKQK